MSTRPKNASLMPWRQRPWRHSLFDVELMAWTMHQLCVSPSAVYRHTFYRKQTKNQWARDDPAFVVVTSALVAGAAATFCATFAVSFWRSVLALISAVFLEYLLLGALLATASWCAATVLIFGSSFLQTQCCAQGVGKPIFTCNHEPSNRSACGVDVCL